MILPAFGVTIDDFDALRAIGCVLVDTTCGSVLNVWKRVESYARDGFTALIHGKYYHEETRATASQVRKYPGRTLPRSSATWTKRGSSATSSRGACRRDALMSTFARAVSPGFDPERHLERIGVANQTTMLARESLAIAEEVGASIARARGDDGARRRTSAPSTRSAARRRSGRTPCASCSTSRVDVMVVIGGFNSSNTISLAALCAERVPTYHIETSAAIDPERGHDPLSARAGEARRGRRADWLAGGSGARRRHGRREHAEQQDRRRRRAHPRDARTAARRCDRSRLSALHA